MEVTIEPVTVLVLLSILLLSLVLLGARLRQNLPPGPLGLPIVGAIPFVSRDLHVSLQRLAKKYGDVMSLKLAGSRCVVLSSVESIREAFNMEVFNGRPKLYLLDLCTDNKRGIIFSEGERWRECRRFSLHTLRDFGLGKLSMEENIREESKLLVQNMRRKAGQVMNIRSFLDAAVANVISRLVYAKHFDYDDAFFLSMIRNIDEGMHLASARPELHFFPVLRYFKPWKTLVKRLCDMKYAADSTWRNWVVGHQNTLEEGEVRDYIDAYLISMNEKKVENRKTYFSENELERVIPDLFAAGAHSIPSTLYCGFAYLLHHQDVQRRCREEIQLKLGGRAPRMADKAVLPYTDATLMEIQRKASMVALGVWHRTTDSVSFHGYHIPRDCCVIPNIYAVHHDTRYWSEPDKFDPERFLDETGKVQRSPALIPFCLGKRMCLGENLANMEMFLYLVSVLQHFTLRPPLDARGQEQLPDLRQSLGVTLAPTPYTVIVS